MAFRWAAIAGKFTFEDSRVEFHGESTKYPNEQHGAALGLANCEGRFTGGTIKAKIRFAQITSASACEIIAYSYPGVPALVTAGIGWDHMFVIRAWDGAKHNLLVGYGDRRNLDSERDYLLEVAVRGSQIELKCDGVSVASALLPPPTGAGQVGLQCQDFSKITVTEFAVERARPVAFAVMQFSSPYDEIYDEVVRRVCEDELEISVQRADETFGPGLIIEDVARQIREADMVLAEITPANPNVYYEVGFAHALGKPTVLLADRSIEKLPFDVSGYRTVFYENSIAGKGKFEKALRRHLKAILVR